MRNYWLLFRLMMLERQRLALEIIKPLARMVFL
jgi:hypothetical protein